VKDIAKFGYNTTIGLAQFHEQVLNRVLAPVVRNQGGRPAIERTGRRGRPAKSKTTKKSAETVVLSSEGRTSKGKGSKGKDRHVECEDINMCVLFVET
jgi:hypothetical protein